MPTRLLITGAAGMLGQDVRRSAQTAGVETVALAHGELDITDPPAVDQAVADAGPHVVINCAAWTDVDGAEADPDGAIAVNATGAGNVARAANGAGAWTLHISSDYVFDGSSREPYLESDPTAPLSAYGRSKLAGEHAVADAAPSSHTLVRSSWLFGAGGRCFPDTILRLAAERDELRVVDDQIGCPTFTGHLARALIDLAQRDRPPLGVLHVAGAGACSWFDFAREIVAVAGSETAVNPCSTREMPRPAPRPAYSVLGTERPAAPRLPPWPEGLREYMAARVAG